MNEETFEYTDFAGDQLLVGEAPAAGQTRFEIIDSDTNDAYYVDLLPEQIPELIRVLCEIAGLMPVVAMPRRRR